MSLTHQLLAALAVAVWFMAWGWVLGRAVPGEGGVHPMRDAVEAVFLTMFAALWFASLGHGGWWVLFIVVGLLVEGPVRLRHRAGLPPEAVPWRPVVLGVVRLVGAGALLALLL